MSLAHYKPLAKCGMEELAARQLSTQPRNGVLFARKEDGEEKIKARQRVLDLFQPDRWSGYLHMLTMPGVQWRFERKLLGAREVGWLRAPRPRRTFFTSVESERAIFYTAAAQMPGLHTPDALVRPIKKETAGPFAELAIKTRYASFFFANSDDLLTQNWSGQFGAAWLDYTGPLTEERLALIKHFYDRRVDQILIVTALKARWNSKTSSAIERAGGHSAWLRQQLDGEILHDLEYFDTSPMAQFAVRHRRSLWMWAE